VHRRLVLTMLSRNEARHALARQIFHGRRGDLYQPYRTGQENQLGALGLVLNAIVLWNTRYLGAAAEHHRNHGGNVDVGDLAHIAPLVSHHLNLQSRYNFALPPQPAGQLRPLRHPERESRSDLAGTPTTTAPTPTTTTKPGVLPATGNSNGPATAFIGLFICILGGALVLISRRRGATRPS
jgi:LPXTG-motif cell wall-anchored protein